MSNLHLDSFGVYDIVFIVGADKFHGNHVHGTMLVPIWDN